MKTVKTDKYIQTGKLYIAKVLNEHPLILFSFLAAGFWLLVSTVIFSIYPEIGSDNISVNQFFLVCIYHTSVLAIFYIFPGLMSLFPVNYHVNINRLSNKLKFHLALSEFLAPNVLLASIIGFFLFNFTLQHKLIIVIYIFILFGISASLYYYFSWFIHRRIGFRKLKISNIHKKKHRKSSNKTSDYVADKMIFPLYYGFLSLIVILQILFTKTGLTNLQDSDGIYGYFTVIMVVVLVLLPSMYIYTY